MPPPYWQPAVELSQPLKASLLASNGRNCLFSCVNLIARVPRLSASSLGRESGSSVGQCPIPPAQLALVLIVQAYMGISDDEVIEELVIDKRFSWSLPLEKVKKIMQRNQSLASWLPLVLYIVFLHLSWVGAWLVFIFLKTTLFPALSNENISSIWWFLVQFVVWLPPVFAYIYYIENQNPLSYLRLTTNLGKGIKWGIIFSLLIPLIALIPLGSKPDPIYCNNLPLLFGSSLPAPITEEIVFRGFLLEQLKTRIGFLKASILSSILFFTIHLVGWFFSGSFPSLVSLLLLLFSLSAFGIFLCYFNRTSNSLLTSMIYHWSNNFYYRRLPCLFKLQ